MTHRRRPFPARQQNSTMAPGGRTVRAMTTEEIRAKVLVIASGRNILPSAPIMKKTGRKPTTVVATAVSTAEPTSLAARWTTSNLGASGGAILRWRRMFSQMTIPMSTIVPMAMAMPDRATMLASTPKSFIATKHISTANGSIAPISTLERRWIIMTMTTTSVTSISWTRASLSVPSVSRISPVRS